MAASSEFGRARIQTWSSRARNLDKRDAAA